MQIETPVDHMMNIYEDSMHNSEDSANDSDDNSHGCEREIQNENCNKENNQRRATTDEGLT